MWWQPHVSYQYNFYKKRTKLQLQTTLPLHVEWFGYDVKGSSYNKKWKIASSILFVDCNGVIKVERKGEAVVLAMDEKGNKEFFDVIIK